jgi:hypothetical protein
VRTKRRDAHVPSNQQTPDVAILEPASRESSGNGKSQHVAPVPPGELGSAAVSFDGISKRSVDRLVQSHLEFLLHLGFTGEGNKGNKSASTYEKKIHVKICLL